MSLDINTLIQCIEESCVYKECKSDDFQMNAVTVGIVTSPNVTCNCSSKVDCCATSFRNTPENQSLQKRQYMVPNVPCNVFGLDMKIVYCMEQIGGGWTENATITIILNLATNPFKRQ